MKDLKNYLRILGYLKPYKWLILLIIASSLLVAISFAGSIGGIKPAADLLFGEFDVETYRKLPLMDTEWGVAFLNNIQELVTRDKFKTLLVVSAIVVFFSLVSSFFKFVHGYAGAYLANRMRLDIVVQLHDNIMKQSLSFFSKQGVSTTITVLGADASLIHRGALILFDKMLMEPLNIVAGLTIAFILNAELATLAVVGFPLMGYTVNRFGRQIKKNTRKGLKISGTVLSLLQESLFGIKIVKSFVMEDYERERFYAQNMRLLKTAMRAVRARQLVSPVINIVAALGIALFIVLGGRDVINGKMSSGSFIAFYAALGAVFGPLRKLSKAVGEIQTSLAGAVRTFEFMDHLPEVRDQHNAAEMPPIKGKVVFDNISFSYDGKKSVIQDLSLRAEPGEIIAFVGFSGAGKTTLINLLLRFYDVSKGQILIDGVDLCSVKQASLRSQIGLVTQETILFNDTVANNICFGRTSYSHEEIVNAAKAANAHEFIQELPQGYDT
ncbi:MAG: ABC transporter ATP-binding protein, partial [Candidatus Abyssubacteria bacterium]|nr:ABC transporter ATP-binding protein [Candidatus Abyssubacteria bacterium]